VSFHASRRRRRRPQAGHADHAHAPAGRAALAPASSKHVGAACCTHVVEARPAGGELAPAGHADHANAPRPAGGAAHALANASAGQVGAVFCTHVVEVHHAGAFSLVGHADHAFVHTLLRRAST